MLFYRALAVAGLVILATFSNGGPSKAAELIMLEEEGCPWCDRWKAEIGVVYAKTAEGKRAPLKILDIHSKRPPKYTFVGPAGFSPTFVLVDNNKEVGRIRGYPGEDFFWPMLQQLLARLDAPKTAKPVAIN